MSDPAASFEPHRAFLVRLAYRMLGAVAEAEDVVQDVFLRWAAAERAAVDEPRAYLARTVSRLCLDRMKSARAQRERYVGTWLPEPLIEPAAAAGGLAEDLSVALLLTLERLSPLQREAVELAWFGGHTYREVAVLLDVAEGTVKTRIRDGMIRLRDELGETP